MQDVCVLASFTIVPRLWSADLANLKVPGCKNQGKILGANILGCKYDRVQSSQGTNIPFYILCRVQMSKGCKHPRSKHPSVKTFKSANPLVYTYIRIRNTQEGNCRIGGILQKGKCTAFQKKCPLFRKKEILQQFSHSK